MNKLKGLLDDERSQLAAWRKVFDEALLGLPNEVNKKLSLSTDYMELLLPVADNIPSDSRYIIHFENLFIHSINKCLEPYKMTSTYVNVHLYRVPENVIHLHVIYRLTFFGWLSKLFYIIRN